MARIRTGTPGGSDDQPARFFRDADEFAAWLAVHHDTAPDLWMELRKAHVARRGLTWADAVPEALRWGWIDSKAERIDEDRTRQRWTPRRAGSTWSAINIAAVEQLIADGRMEPPGLAAFERRRTDRSAVYSHEQTDLELPVDAAARLAANPGAAAFWAEATPGYRKVCTHWVTSAKREATQEQRLTQLIEDCAAGRLIKIERYGGEPKWLARAAAAARAAG